MTVDSSSKTERNNYLYVFNVNDHSVNIKTLAPSSSKTLHLHYKDQSVIDKGIHSCLLWEQRHFLHMRFAILTPP
jgi:hypothetical protein